MTPHQKIFAIVTSAILLLMIIELVRRRKLRVEYSWLWIFTGAAIMLLVVRYELLELITNMIGAVAPTTTLFIFAILFLMIVGLFFSMKITDLTARQKNLAQQVALLRFQLEQQSGEKEIQTKQQPQGE